MENTDNEKALMLRIRELEGTVEVLEKDLIHDGLTGLKTRAFFEEEARVYFDVVTDLRNADRKQWFGFKNISFIFLDIDHFKSINDTFGHAFGDEVLQKVSENISSNVRDGDTCARWGGEEFVVTLVGATERDAKKKAEDIRKDIETIKFDKEPDLVVTISLGVSTAESGCTFEEIIERADKALYKAKHEGRNKVVAYSEII